MKERFNQLFFPNDTRKEHFRALDGLRGIAVLLVLLSHSSNSGLFFSEYLNFSEIGKVGVYLFFVLSAYLLDRQIAISLMSGKSNKLYWKNYFLRRFLRIYPLFVVAILVHGLVTLLGFETVIDHWSDIPDHLFLVEGEGVFWSIPVEFKYYFISPLIMLFCHKYLKWNPTYTFIFLIGTAISAVFAQRLYHLSLTSTYRYFPIFLMGTLISIYELILKNKYHLEKYKPYFEYLGIVSLIILMTTIPYYFQLIFGKEINFHHYYFYLYYALSWGAILIAAKYGIGFIARILACRLLRFLGTISFSIYLFHVPILNMFKAHYFNIPSWLEIYLFFIFTILLAMVTYVFIEKPLSKVRLYKKELTEAALAEKKVISS